LGKESLKLPQDQRQAWLAQKSREQEESQWKIAGKQVEEILTPRQVELYKTRAFPDLVYAMLRYPEFLKLVGATPEQRDELAKIETERERQTQKHEQRYHDQFVSVLSREQQRKLRAELGRADQPTPEGAIGFVTLLGNPLEINAPAALGPFPDTSWAVPAYGELSRGATRKQLGFTAAQEKRWQQIAADYRKKTEGLAYQAPEQWKRLASEFRREVEGLLTGQQLAALKEIGFFDRIRGLAQNRELVKKLGITEEQKAGLRWITREYGQSVSGTNEEAREKSLAVLTAVQMQELREELDRRGAW
jgi:hypothetical protein